MFRIKLNKQIACENNNNKQELIVVYFFHTKLDVQTDLISKKEATSVRYSNIKTIEKKTYFF